MAIVSRYCNSDTGNDANDGLTPATAMLTIQAALDDLGAGNTSDARIILAGTAAFQPSNLSVPWNSAAYGCDIRGTAGTETIDLQTTNTMFSAAKDYIKLTNLVFTNVGSRNLNWRTACCIDGCDITTTAQHPVAVNLGTNNVIRNTTIRAGGQLTSLGSSHLIEFCTFIGPASASNGYLYFPNQPGYVRHCRFYNYGVYFTNNAGMVVDHCSFYGGIAFLSDAGIYGSRSYYGELTNNVFSNAPVGIFLSPNNYVNGLVKGNYVFSVTTPISANAQIVDRTEPVALTSAPYTDPPNEDWTLSAELAAIVGSDGLTPGAVQATAAAAGSINRGILTGGRM